MSKPKSNMQVPISWSGQDKRFGDSVKENLDVIVGHRGDPLDKAITARDLLESGIATLPSGISAYGGSSGDLVPPTTLPDLTIPPAPTNLSASGAFQNVLLTWSLADYAGHAYVEVWRNATNNIATAARLDTATVSSGVVYADNVGSGQSFYYWVRAVNQNGDVGPYNSSSGTLGSTATDTSVLLSALSGSITDSQLATDLSTSIGEIGGIKTDVQDLEGQYTVKIDNNGAVAGYGLANTANSAGNITSEFIVNADRFAIMRGGSDTTAATVPFVVQTSATTHNGVSVPAGVYMADAFIQNGAITNAKIGNAAIDDAKIANLSAGKITSGTIDTSLLNIDSSSITSVNGVLQIGNLSANKITSGTLDASNVTIDNLYANNITGDINDLRQFSLASAVQIGGGDTQVWAGQFPAMPTGGKPKKPYISAVGFGNWENDVVYKIKLQMRPNVPATTTTVGTITGVTALLSSPPYLYLPASISISGDVQSKVQTGGSLRIGSTTRGTVVFTNYAPSLDKTYIYYNPVNGGFSSSHVGSTATHVITPSFITVSTSMFRPDYDDHPEPFVISGGLPSNYSVTVDARIMFDTLYTNQGNLPNVGHSTDWTNDKVFALDGLMMSLR